MNILYLCTGNSCRSQMAEGWTRHLGGADIAVRSAGLEAHGLNPNAVATMQAAGVDISAQQSAVLADADLDWADRVVTVCGHADEHCPLLPAGTHKQHWPIDDPAGASGSAEQIAAVFADTRDLIRGHVEALLAELGTARD
ncbi:arsenate reductase ArsC [Salinisphaera aquimarina]|uniref:Arsenate reductase ArsC n=1 Tax=Salinisphaera aquimarina TaxID=2094031 RepID=A0ABV7EQX2_9GAMM